MSQATYKRKHLTDCVSHGGKRGGRDPSRLGIGAVAETLYLRQQCETGFGMGF